MRERPILFSAPMVRAILAGEKTQTRRILKQADFSQGMHPGGLWADAVHPARESGWIAWQGKGPRGSELEAFTKIQYAHGFLCPYGQPGDRLWVRETWYKTAAGEILYRADYGPESYEGGAKGWKPSIFMRREHSRINLEVVGVHVERVQDISEADIKAEGVIHPGSVSASLPRPLFHGLWNSINGKRYPWESNPWVWVVEFKRVLP